MVKAVQVGHAQALRCDGLQRVGAAHQGHGLAMRGQTAAHITTDGACAENDEVHGNEILGEWARCPLALCRPGGLRSGAQATLGPSMPFVAETYGFFGLHRPTIMRR